MMKKKVAILLATYNSTNFLDELLESIIIQTYSNWILYIRDDCSNDETLSILNKWIKEYPEQIVIINNNNKSLGSYHSFVHLLREVDSDYYMFCDHDDVWLKDKIEKSMICFDELEKKYANMPILVHTDMVVVNEKLEIIHSSFWNYSKLLPQHNSFKELVACNCANGCTMLFNKMARSIALDNVDFCLMHDVLIAFTVAAKGGVIYAINTPTVLYRQHGNNVLGASHVNVYFWISKLRKLPYLVKKNYHTWKMACQIKKYTLFEYLYYKFKIFVLRLL